MDFVDILKKAGCKITPERRTLLSYMQNHRKPRTPQEIHQGLQRHNIDLATIYRSLQLFQKLGIVFEEEILGRTTYFLSNHEHHHITCRKCKKMKCLPCTIRIPKLEDFSNIKHHFTLTGICNNCLK